MAFCTECGHQLAAGAKFCYECGAKVNVPSSPHVEQRKTVYDGEIHKCPNCGEIVNAYDMICKSCGYEIRGRQTTSIVHELSLKLENTSDSQKKDELIRTFYIPNTREDIYEFFMLALSQIKIGGKNTDAWMVKLEQAYQKAEIAFQGNPEFNRLKPMYKEAQLLNRKNSKIGFLRSSTKYFRSGYAWALLFLIISLIGFFMTLILENFGDFGFFSDLAGFFYTTAFFSIIIAACIALVTLYISWLKILARGCKSVFSLFINKDRFKND